MIVVVVVGVLELRKLPATPRKKHGAELGVTLSTTSQLAVVATPSCL